MAASKKDEILNNIEDIDSEVISLLSFEPENDDGDTEYKRMLVGKTKPRIDELETQMRYRMEEGDGQCTYVIGVDDDGTPFGLNDEEYLETRRILEKICKRNDYSLRLLIENECNRKSNPPEKKEPLKIYEFLIRENNTIDYEEVKIAVGGNVNASKSTTVGVLISGQLDDGRGSARLKVLNFKHEVETGRSSSISQQILGYEPDGTIVNHDTSIKKISWPEIAARSSKIIKFFDLCGHTKYSRTTLRGMIANSVDYAFITIGSNMGVKGSTKEHIGVCITLQIPIVILLTKIDLGEKAPETMKETINDIKKMFSRPGARKMLFTVNNMNDVVTVSKTIKTGDIVPIFKTSNTRGDGLNLIHEFLNMSRPRIEFNPDQPVEMHIDETFTPKGIGLVVGGFLKKGTLKINSDYWIGPMGGAYKKVRCRSLHVNRTQVQEATPGRYVCVNLPKVERNAVSRGIVLLSDNVPRRVVNEFTAEITVYRTHHTTIRVGYETMIHINTLRVTAKLLEIINKKKIKLKKSSESLPIEESADDVLSLGDRAIIRMKFSHKSCYINVGDRILLAETQVKMTGKILTISEE